LLFIGLVLEIIFFSTQYTDEVVSIVKQIIDFPNTRHVHKIIVF